LRSRTFLVFGSLLSLSRECGKLASGDLSTGSRLSAATSFGERGNFDWQDNTDGAPWGNVRREERTVMGNRLYVGNLAFQTSEDVIRDVFTESGEVTDVKLVIDRDTGRSRGFAFVTMASDEAAQKAISELDGATLDGRPLRVNEAEERSQRGSGGGGGRGGFGGGGGGGGRGFGGGGGGGGFGGGGGGGGRGGRSGGGGGGGGRW
jgi:RNA recognition motif-containing protein